MAHDSLTFKEKFQTCPYNASHSIDPLRMAKHLIKCKKQYPDVKMRICDFNATHHVREENYLAHISECKDKDVVERDIFIRENPEILSNNVLIQCENVESEENKAVESWDSEIVDVSSYNPEASIIYKEIPRQPPIGLGKAGRKLWREIDIERISRLQKGEDIGDLAYPTVDGGEIRINEITREHSSSLDLEEFKNYLLEKNSNLLSSSSRKPKELPELPRPKNFQKQILPSKNLDTESEASSCSFSFRKAALVKNNHGIMPKNEGDFEDLAELVNTMNISSKTSLSPKNSEEDYGQRKICSSTAHRMILRQIRRK